MPCTRFHQNALTALHTVAGTKLIMPLFSQAEQAPLKMQHRLRERGSPLLSVVIDVHPSGLMDSI